MIWLPSRIRVEIRLRRADGTEEVIDEEEVIVGEDANQSTEQAGSGNRN